MATTTSFSAMLNDYLPNELLKEEFIKRNYLYQKVEKDEGWVGAVGSSTNGGSLIVPFRGAAASSIAYGALSGSTDIAEDSYVRGIVTTQKEAWGSMIFNHRDIMEHNKVSEKNFLKLLPDTITDFMMFMQNTVSVNLLNGAHFCTMTADGDSSGNLTVDRPDRLQIGQKVYFKDNDTALSSAGYIKTINMNTNLATVVTTRGGSTPLDISNYTVAQAGKVYVEGASTAAFQSLRLALLSAANGGDTTIHGQTKTAYPYLQAINVLGSDISAVNIVEKIFDALTQIRQKGKGNPSDVLMSYKNFGSCIKVIEASKGSFNVTPGSQKASQYGWMELEVGSVTKGGLKLVGVQEADDDVIYFIDWNALKFYSNGGFRKRASPDGIEYFEVRNTTGYQYIVDICLFGELVVHRPSCMGILYSISY
jgi:hypothetical protein